METVFFLFSWDSKDKASLSGVQKLSHWWCFKYLSCTTPQFHIHFSKVLMPCPESMPGTEELPSSPSCAWRTEAQSTLKDSPRPTQDACVRAQAVSCFQLGTRFLLPSQSFHLGQMVLILQFLYLWYVTARGLIWLWLCPCSQVH